MWILLCRFFLNSFIFLKWFDIWNASLGLGSLLAQFWQHCCVGQSCPGWVTMQDMMTDSAMGKVYNREAGDQTPKSLPPKSFWFHWYVCVVCVDLATQIIFFRSPLSHQAEQQQSRKLGLTISQRREEEGWRHPAICHTGGPASAGSWLAWSGPAWPRQSPPGGSLSPPAETTALAATTPPPLILFGVRVSVCLQRRQVTGHQMAEETTTHTWARRQDLNMHAQSFFNRETTVSINIWSCISCTVVQRFISHTHSTVGIHLFYAFISTGYI